MERISGHRNIRIGKDFALDVDPAPFPATIGVAAKPLQKGETMAVKAVPEGFHTVTPLLVVQGGAKLIDFIKNAFGGGGG